jgi:outer membrane receptor for ferrienterochelin and colicins
MCQVLALLGVIVLLQPVVRAEMAAGRVSGLPAAQGPWPFEGLVLDPNAVPVAGARVLVREPGLEAASGLDGKLRLDLLPGTYQVRVEAKGFEPRETSLRLDEQAYLKGFVLMLDFQQELVVVTATRTERLVEDVPVPTKVIGRRELERRQVANLAESLDQTTGVRVEMNCQNCGFTEVRLNGLEGQYTQILVDGRPVVSALAGVYLAEQIPEEMIDRIEIVKGGGSALYGGNAVGGVVHVITRRPVRNFASLTYRGAGLGLGRDGWGSDHRLSGNAGLVNADRSLGVHLFAGLQEREAWDANGDGFSEIGQIEQLEGGLAAFLEPLVGLDLQLKAHFLKEARRGGDQLDRPEHDAGVAESIRSDRIGIDVQLRHRPGPGFNWEAGYSLASTRRNSYYGGGGDVDPWSLLPDSPGGFTPESWLEFLDAMQAKQGALAAYGRTRNLVHAADAAGNLHLEGLGDHVLTVGLQFTGDDLQDRFVGYDRVIDAFYWDVAGFVQHNWIWASWGEWLLGLRLDGHSELAEPVASPRLALKLSPLAWLTLRTSFSTGFRAPQVFDEDLHVTIMGGEAQVITNQPGLEPERSYSVSQQVALDFEPSARLRLQVGLNGFYTLLTDRFALLLADDPATPVELEFSRVNAGRAQVWGGELELALEHASGFWLDAGLTLQRAELADPDPDFGSRSLFRAPWLYGFVALRLEPWEGLRLMTSLEITGPMRVPHYEGNVPRDAQGDPIPQLERSPWFFVWDASVSYRWTPLPGLTLEPHLAIRNILDSFQADFDTGPDRDAGYVYGPRLPRALFGGLRATF